MSGTIDTWIAGSGSWSTPANWQNGLPGPQADATFTGTAAIAVAFATSASIDGLTGSDVNATLELNSGTLSIATGGSWAGLLTQSAATLDLTTGALTLLGAYAEAAQGNDQITGGATLDLAGGATLAGTIAGQGELAFTGAASDTVNAAAALQAGTVDIDSNGTVTLNANATLAGTFELVAGELALNGHTVTLNGPSYLGATVAGPGTLTVAAPGTVNYETLTGGAVLSDAGLLLQGGNLQLGTSTADSTTLSIASGATYDLLYDTGVGAQGSAAIVNRGLLEKSGDSGASTLAADLTSSGTIAVNQGSLVLTGTVDTVTGTVEGAGAFDIEAGALTLAPTTLDTAGFGIYGADVTLAGIVGYSGAFVLSGGTLAITSGHFLKLNASGYLDGTVAGPGSVYVVGTADVNYLTLTGGATLSDDNLITQTANFTIGASSADTASLQIASADTYDILNDSVIYANGTASIVNAHLFEKTGINGTSYVYADMDSTGTIAATQGLLALAGASDTLSGVLSGAGEIDLRGGGTFSIGASTQLSVTTLGIYDGGTHVTLHGNETDNTTFNLGGGAEVNLNATTLTLRNGALQGAVGGPGEVLAQGTVEVGNLLLTGGATLDDAGTLVQDYYQVTLGISTSDSSSLVIAAGHVYDIRTDNNINADGTASISNAGLLEKTGVTGTSYVYADLVSTGTITATAGDLALAGPTDRLSGALTGAGEIDLRGGGHFTLAAGTTLSVARLGIYDNGTQVTLDANASYAGTFELGGNAEVYLNHTTLTLKNAALQAAVAGPGTVLVQGSAETGGLTLTGGATLDDASTITQDYYNVSLGASLTDSATLLVGAGDTYDLRTDNNIYADGTAAISDAGLFEKTGFTGTSNVYADFDNTGTLALAEGTLALYGASNTLGGQISGAGVLDLGNSGGGTSFTLAAGVSLGVAAFGIYDGGTGVTLDGSVTYRGTFTLGGSADLDLNAQVFTLAGSGLLQGYLQGGGTLLLSGSADAQYLTLTDAATLDVTGTLSEDARIGLGTGASDQAAIIVAAGALYVLESDDTISAPGTATITNTGTFEKRGTDGTSTVNAAFTNQGQVLAETGTISFAGALTNASTITASDASVLVSGSLTAGSGKLGVFDIGSSGTVGIYTAVDSTQSFAFTGKDGTLRLSDPSAFLGTIAGFGSTDTIDLAGIAANGLSYSNGQLIVTETQNGTLEASYTLDAPGIANPGSLALVYDNAGGTEIVQNHTGPQVSNPSGSIITDYWTVDASGTWSDGANWYQVVPAPPPIYSETLHVQPNAGNDAQFTPSGSVDFTVTYDETDTVNQLSGGTTATLDMTGGTLTINNGGAWSGGFTNAGGTLDAVTGWAAYGPTSLAADATDEVDSGTFAVGSGTLAGTITGQGQFYLVGGDHFTLEPGVTITSGTFDLGVDGDGFGSNTTLDTNVSYSGRFILTDYTGNSANLFLNGKNLVLRGTSNLNGYVAGSGWLYLGGTNEIAALTVNNSANVVVEGGTVVQDGLLTTGTGAGTDDTLVDITATGVWNFVNNNNINGYGGTTIDNAGLLEKTGGTGSSNISGAKFIDTGSIAIATGALSIGAGSNTLDGAITGPGELYLDGGPSFTIESGATITTPIFDLGVNGDGFGSNTTLETNFSYAGDLILSNYSGNAANLFLNGRTLTLSGTAYLNGYISGTGAVDIAGTADIPGLTINNSATVNVNGLLTEDGGLTIGNGALSPDSTAIAIASGGTYDFLDDAQVALYGASSVTNAGLLEKTGGTGVSGLFGGDFINTGTLLIATGEFDVITASLGGVITGAGTLGLYVGTSTLEAGATLNTSGLALLLNGDGFGASLVLDENLGYGGSFYSYDYSGNATFLDLNGFTARFTGSSFWNGIVNGTGTLDLAGTADIAGEGVSDAVVNITNLADSTGNLGMSDGASLAIAAGGTFNLLTDGDAETGASSLTNAGLIAKNGVDGASYIYGNLTNTGTVWVNAGWLNFWYASSSTIGGVTKGTGAVYYTSGGTYTLEPTAVFTVATLGFAGDILFGANLSYSGNFTLFSGTLALDGFTLTLGGPSVLDGEVLGGGTLTISAKETASTTGLTLAGSAVLNDAGTLIEDGTLTFGASASDATTLEIVATGVLDFNADTYGGSQGTPSLVNAGLIEKTGGTGVSYLYTALTNTGTILASKGTLAFYLTGASSLGGTVEGGGAVALDSGSATLQPGVALSVATLEVNGSAALVLSGDLSYAGNYQLGGGTQDLHGDTLTLTGATNLYGLIEGPGTLNTEGATLLTGLQIGGGATLENQQKLSASGNVTLGDANGSGTVVNAAGAVWDFIADSAIYLNATASESVDNLGLFEKTAGSATSPVTANFTNAAGATIDVATGTIALEGKLNSLAGTVTGPGALAVSNVATITSLSVAGGSSLSFLGGAWVTGTIVETGATLFTAGTLFGPGTVEIGATGLVTVGGTVNAGPTLAFTAATGTLDLQAPGAFGGTIAKLVAGDTIDLVGTPTADISGLSYAGTHLTIDLVGGGKDVLNVPGSFTTGSFSIASDGHNGTAITVH